MAGGGDRDPAADAGELEIEDWETVLVWPRRGEARVKTRVTDDSSRGVANMSFHGKDVLTTIFTNAALDLELRQGRQSIRPEPS